VVAELINKSYSANINIIKEVVPVNIISSIKHLNKPWYTYFYLVLYPDILVSSKPMPILIFKLTFFAIFKSCFIVEQVFCYLWSF